MRYERRSELAAAMGITSVVAAIVSTLMSHDISRTLSLPYIALVMAAAAASLAVFTSRLLGRTRAKRRVFLIYAREDLDAARKLAAQLKDGGFMPWLDVDEISPGEIWRKAVLRALEESAVALVLVSQHLSKKGFVQDELKVALETLHEQKQDISPVVPVRLDDSEVPEQLSHVQWVDLREEHGLERLLAGLNKSAPRVNGPIVGP